MPLDQIIELNIGDTIEIKYHGEKRVGYLIKECEEAICLVPSWRDDWTDTTTIDAVNPQELQVYSKNSLEQLEVIKKSHYQSLSDGKILSDDTCKKDELKCDSVAARDDNKIIDDNAPLSSENKWKYDPVAAGDNGYRSPNRGYRRKTYPWLPGGVVDKGH